MKPRRAIKKLVFGDTLLPQEFTIGLEEPQTEIAVWLHGMDASMDVTYRYAPACSKPFVICVALDEAPTAKYLKGLSLQFRERGGAERVLGEIGLKLSNTASAAGPGLFLFEPRSSRNYCLPKRYLCAHYLLDAYTHWRSKSEIKMSILERWAAIVTFIRPHPVALVSLAGEDGGNIFPMNLMGTFGNGRFGFALRESRQSSRLVEEAGRIAVSSVPVSQAQVAYHLAGNHTKRSIVWDQVPFATKMSATFGIPVPVFALRVREMKVEKVHKLGSHRFFVARIICDETYARSPGLNVIHGFYQAWRLNGHSARLKASIAEDWFNKRKLSRL
jgi:flavin reductase (DIM6/NTAB) family NADH-FMN oxidoreductase RutF